MANIVPKNVETGNFLLSAKAITATLANILRAKIITVVIMYRVVAMSHLSLMYKIIEEIISPVKNPTEKYLIIACSIQTNNLLFL